MEMLQRLKQGLNLCFSIFKRNFRGSALFQRGTAARFRKNQRKIFHKVMGAGLLVFTNQVQRLMPKWALATSMDLYLYPRLFEPLFRGFFGKAARFRSRQNVEFEQAFLLVLPNTHSKHRYQRVSRLCDVSDVKTAGKPHPTPGRNHGVLAMLGREKAKHPLPVQWVVVYLLDLSRASVFNVTPIMSLWASRLSRQSGERNVSAF